MKPESFNPVSRNFGRFVASITNADVDSRQDNRQIAFWLLRESGDLGAVSRQADWASTLPQGSMEIDGIDGGSQKAVSQVKSWCFCRLSGANWHFGCPSAPSNPAWGKRCECWSLKFSIKTPVTAGLANKRGTIRSIHSDCASSHQGSSPTCSFTLSRGSASGSCRGLEGQPNLTWI